MASLLPLQKAPRLHLESGQPRGLQAQRYDAVLLLLPTDGKPANTLPDAGRWQILHRRGKPSHGALRSTSFDNARQTLALLVTANRIRRNSNCCV
jgi:hypothetical protein